LQKLNNILAFYKSTLPVNLVLSITPLFFGKWDSSAITFITMGFIISIAIKEVDHPEYYLFYHNNGLSKFALWAYSFTLNLIAVAVISSIKLIVNHFG